MGIQVAINHRTSYEYDRRVTLSPHVVRLRPAPHCRTPVTSYSLRIDPPDHFLNWQQDPHGNHLARAVFQTPARRFRIEVDLVAELTVINPFDFFLEASAERFPFEYEPWLARDLRPYLESEPPGPELRKHLAAVDTRPRRTVDFLVALNQQLERRIDYVIRMEPGIQTCEDTLARGSGSCRDSAWLLVQILRHLGLAARFVSGYLIQLVPDVKPLEGPTGPPRDFTDLHAWVEAYLPGAGWVGLDPTSGMLAAEGHLPVAATAEPAAAAPISGSVSEAEVEFDHAMTVTRLSEAPRVTRPYSEAAWSAVDALGRAIDRTLADNDVRLTMGGEPTFVSIDDMEGDEWSYDALGPAKRRLSAQLVRRLQGAFGPGGLLHDGQGKQYPGEPLPRWALGCYWRTDGQPLWRNRALLADPTDDHGHGPAQAEALIRRLADRLAVSPGYAVAAYEDPLPYLHHERRIPVNLAPGDPRLERADDRERLRRVLEGGLGRPVAWVLPLARATTAGGTMWQSGLWLLRGRHLFLTPGDSPAGLRLPLESLAWVDPRHAAPVVAQDPLAPRRPLPARDILPRREPRPAAPPPGPRDRPPATGESADGVVRTALVVQPREGRLHVFLPPLAAADDYVDLLARVEDAAAELETPVVVEGYPPPSDPRVSVLKVTPDPGVIEVNTHPARTWEELVSITTTLYDAARDTRLGTEKFMLDGRHSGTGGGNHVVLGGPTAADSPFLRRPDLLRSLVAYWINHPSLSYLFSGLFIGPTSQAPRVDETRPDSLAELEIAFEQIDRSGPECPPWLVDRVFRHLLVDVTGNTHRAEFCIDKLYAPETASGRQGLVELRAFEMPPHPRMSLTQQLLLRGLVAWCWARPYRRPVVRWGARLHDEFMLPHYVRRDFEAVIGDLREAGFPFEVDWFDAHFEFRYPRIGRVACAGVELELRTAGEPWYVLGEEPHAGATARYVDSSVERLQVLVRGAVDGRHVVTCNRRRLPLRPTGTDGELVAGVRYRAWQPPSCLHPTIGVHTPLTFDVVDTWSGRSVGGCTHHVSHPGGLGYETFPVNAAEAETRRATRFHPFGHTPGPLEPGPPEANPAAPHTLDLRRAAPPGPSPETNPATGNRLDPRRAAPTSGTVPGVTAAAGNELDPRRAAPATAPPPEAEP